MPVKASPPSLLDVDDYLWLILEYVPFSKLLSMRLVCTRWNRLISRLFGWKKSLKLLTTEHGFAKYEHSLNVCLVDAFIRRSISKNDARDCIIPRDGDCTQLRGYLSATLTKLLIQEDLSEVTLTGLDTLLTYWAGTLTCLTLHGECLLAGQSLNQLTRLTELHLLYINYRHFDLANCPLLSQLAKFSLVSYPYDDIDAILRSLHKCTQLWLCKVPMDSSLLTDILTVNPPLAINLTHLSIGPFANALKRDERQSILTLICSSFTNLLYFNAEFAYELNPIEMLNQLARLPALKHLKLHLNLQWGDIPPQSTVSPSLASVSKLELLLYKSYFSVDDFARLFTFRFPLLASLTVKGKYLYLMPGLRSICHNYRLFPKLRFCDFL